ncbi:MAG: ABC transporter ATP-binding protein, partial [Mariniblastus sp.]
LRDQGKCIVFSSHIMSEVKRLCDRVAIMNRGVILAEGTPTHLAEKHEENDMEELFYQLISQSEAQLESDKSVAAASGVLTSQATN